MKARNVAWRKLLTDHAKNIKLSSVHLFWIYSSVLISSMFIIRSIYVCIGDDFKAWICGMTHFGVCWYEHNGYAAGPGQGWAPAPAHSLTQNLSRSLICVPGVRGFEPCLIWPGPNITDTEGPEPIGTQCLSCQSYWPMRSQHWNWPVTSLTGAQSHYNGDKSAGAPSWHPPTPNLDLTGCSNPPGSKLRVTNPLLLTKRWDHWYSYLGFSYSDRHQMNQTNFIYTNTLVIKRKHMDPEEVNNCREIVSLETFFL